MNFFFFTKNSVKCIKYKKLSNILRECTKYSRLFNKAMAYILLQCNILIYKSNN